MKNPFVISSVVGCVFLVLGAWAKWGVAEASLVIGSSVLFITFILFVLLNPTETGGEK